MNLGAYAEIAIQFRIKQNWETYDKDLHNLKNGKELIRQKITGCIKITFFLHQINKLIDPHTSFMAHRPLWLLP